MLAVLGEGGFGRVYRARLEGPSGFSKDVALKLLSDENAPEHVVERFRDEARILGLVRDRAIVGVDPPVKLGGRWAVIMEYVDGCSARALLREGPFPLGAAVEVVGEIARALDKLWNLKGPDFRPLHLLHRDLKPQNIQITPAGEVKVLDFGIAKADFSARESHTTTSIGGTPGYIAPERTRGEELPAGDIYSLGVVLHELATGARFGRGEVEWHEEPGMTEVRALARKMVAREPEDRPTAREVASACQDLRAWLPKPYLHDWAEKAIASVKMLPPDQMVGTVLSETLSSVPRGPDSLPDEYQPVSGSTSRSRYGIAAALGGVASAVIGGGVVVAVVAIGVGVWWATRVPEVKVAPVPTVAPVVAPPVVATVEVPAVDTDVQAVADTDTPTSTSTATGTSTPTSTSVVHVATAAAAVATAPPSGATMPVLLTSIPMGATVTVDGKALGATPLLSVPLTFGPHTLHMSVDGKDGDLSVDVEPGSPGRYVWRAAEGQWQ